MAKFICLLAMIFSLNACVPWPKHSTGGYASHYIFTRTYQKSLFKNNYNYIYSQQLYKLTKQTYALSNSHAFKCFPSRLKLLKRLGVQIAQEIDSGLLVAAKTDLALYENNLAIICRINKQKTCVKPKKDINWEYLKSKDQ